MDMDIKQLQINDSSYIEGTITRAMDIKQLQINDSSYIEGTICLVNE